MTRWHGLPVRFPWTVRGEVPPLGLSTSLLLSGPGLDRDGTRGRDRSQRRKCLAQFFVGGIPQQLSEFTPFDISGDVYNQLKIKKLIIQTSPGPPHGEGGDGVKGTYLSKGE